MTSSLVGSEMCIRDSLFSEARLPEAEAEAEAEAGREGERDSSSASSCSVSYTHLTLPTICSV
eukprot:5620656-Prorocentrum_lima.AAC.1